ncbi:MAG: MBL fold metallo-hydrolase [Clostridia bacterium]|nr:MBL fold metallo-hydrolase [Clostridia bacterium]
MNIRKFSCGPMGANCYLLENEDFAAVIDPSELIECAVELLKSKKKDKYILLTHCHFDHIAAAGRLRDETGVPIYVHRLDFDAVSDPNINLSGIFGFPIDSFSADKSLYDGDTLSAGQEEIRVIQTAGHTAGSVCYMVGDVLISGDTLFENSIGRTDFPTSDVTQMKNSLDRLCRLPDETKVYSGHGDETTIGREKLNNPYLRYFR